jgi:hypothetical protein
MLKVVECSKYDASSCFVVNWKSMTYLYKLYWNTRYIFTSNLQARRAFGIQLKLYSVLPYE